MTASLIKESDADADPAVDTADVAHTQPIESENTSGVPAGRRRRAAALGVDIVVPVALIAAVLLGTRGLTASEGARTAAIAAAGTIAVLSLLNLVGWQAWQGHTLGNEALGFVTRRVGRTSWRTPERVTPRKIARTVVLVLLCISVIGLAVGVTAQSAGETSDDRAVAQMRNTAAGEAGTIVKNLLTYKYATVDAEIASAQQRLTGQFLDYYRTYTEQVVIPTAREKQVTTVAEVTGTAVTEATADAASVLVFLNQTTTSTDDQNPVSTASTVLVHLVRSEGVLKVDELVPS
ncbi:hypothetical protein [Williamsia sp. DF01-3]|uniref:hypothetical protein n=1 Tax=Williamsia sp. DF01-3 TaxID=2934157 RepID=UPI001FF240BB|nr:hypothetical protein [Williamsia sp. DF01-3]MCK0516764.1 hypothetical protein [Williamsia sp. DF01-3]